MTEKEIQDGNSLICEFMNLTGYGEYYDYNNNYNLLFSTFEKINKFGIIEFTYSLVPTFRICYLGSKYEEALNFYNNSENQELNPHFIFEVIVDFLKFVKSKNKF